MNLPTSGFSLVEVLVTMVLVSVISTAVLSSMSSTLSVNQSAERRIDAVLIAQEKMDDVKRLDPASLPSSGSKNETVTLKGRDYLVTLRYCAVPSYCQNSNRQVAIDVKYGNVLMFSGESVFTEVRVEQ